MRWASDLPKVPRFDVTLQPAGVGDAGGVVVVVVVVSGVVCPGVVVAVLPGCRGLSESVHNK